MEDPIGLPAEPRSARHDTTEAETVGSGADVFDAEVEIGDETIISERSSELELSSVAVARESDLDDLPPEDPFAGPSIHRDTVPGLHPDSERKSDLVRSYPLARSTSPAAETDKKPSFWRRLALGRKTEAEVPAPSRPATPIDIQIVEPLLQAMVSIEAKLERSHDELAGRLDSVDQRLTQLWEIEEQLGAISEVQESIGRLADQQQRIEATQLAVQRGIRNLALILIVVVAAGAFTLAALFR